jgi:hypothetical protein
MKTQTMANAVALRNWNIAHICHEANRAYCLSIGDRSQSPWDSATKWQQESMVAGVEFCLANPDAPPSANHEAWLQHKLAEGWKYGETKDPEKKEHPCCVPYDQLPDEQKVKDRLIKAIVAVLSAEPVAGNIYLS